MVSEYKNILFKVIHLRSIIGYNSLVFALKKTPLIGDLIPDKLYSTTFLKVIYWIFHVIVEVFKLFIGKIFGSKADRDYKAVKPTLQKILAVYPEIDALSNDDLRARSAALKQRLREVEAPFEDRMAQIREELGADIKVTGFLTTVEHDYPNFHLSMDCFRAELMEGSEMTLLEHEAAKWLDIKDIDSVDWLPADIKVVQAVKQSH